MRVLSEIENRFDQAIAQHKKIIAIIENKEVDQVEKILREHIMEPIKLWEKLYSKIAHMLIILILHKKPVF